MRRLATQIHATVVAVLVLFAALLGAAWWHGPGMRDESRLAEAVAETAGEMLPGPERPVAELRSALERLAPRFGLDAAVFSPAGERLAWTGAPLPLPAGDGPRRHWTRASGRVLFAVRLPDGRRLVASRPRPDWRHLGGLVTDGGPAGPRGRGRRVAAGAPADAAAREAAAPRRGPRPRRPRAPERPSRGGTRSPTSPAVSTARRTGSSGWSRRSVGSSPLPRTSCARPLRGCACRSR